MLQYLSHHKLTNHHFLLKPYLALSLYLNTFMNNLTQWKPRPIISPLIQTVPLLTMLAPSGNSSAARPCIEFLKFQAIPALAKVPQKSQLHFSAYFLNTAINHNYSSKNTQHKSYPMQFKHHLIL